LLQQKYLFKVTVQAAVHQLVAMQAEATIHQAAWVLTAQAANKLLPNKKNYIF
jgi:hypothetical protein